MMDLDNNTSYDEIDSSVADKSRKSKRYNSECIPNGKCNAICSAKWVSWSKVRLFICVGLWGFLTGVERAIILPTLWLYLAKMFSEDAATTYYGLALTAFNLSTLISTPIYGFLCYCGIPAKALLVGSNQFEVVGNIIYFLASEPWLVMFGRFVAGLGGGAEVPLYGDIVRATTKKERTLIIMILLLCKQFGLIVGPACTLLVSETHFQVGEKSFNVYNLPGLMMAISWAFSTVLSLAIYPDINDLVQMRINKELGESDSVELTNKEELSKKSTALKSQSSIPDNETIPILHAEEMEEKSISMRMRNGISQVCPNASSIVAIKKYYLKLEPFALLFTTFALYICIMGLEAVLPPVAIKNFGWSEVQTSYVYLGCGGCIVIGFGFLILLCKYYADRTVIIIGVSLLICSYTTIMVLLILVNAEQKVLYIVLCMIGIAIHVFGVEFSMTCTESLFSKIIPVEEADRGQSIYRTVVNISYLIGPFMGGSLQMIAYVVMLVQSVLMIASLIFVSVAYKKLLI